MPRRYRFVAPHGVGTKLHDLLKKPEELKRELIANWEKYCCEEISEAEPFPLEGPLKAYVEGFDFRIVWFLTPYDALEQHRNTRHWHRRFKIDAPVRPDPPPPPDAFLARELAYAMRLLEAYADRLKRAVSCVEDLKTAPQFQTHFRRSRGHFFSAEALARFSRDQFAPGAFETVKRHIHDGVVDVTLAAHADAFQCVVEVARAAVGLQLPHSDLVPYVGPADRIGMCHHLANDGKLSWVRQ